MENFERTRDAAGNGTVDRLRVFGVSVDVLEQTHAHHSPGYLRDAARSWEADNESVFGTCTGHDSLECVRTRTKHGINREQNVNKW